MISADGRFVVFISAAKLGPGSPNILAGDVCLARHEERTKKYLDDNPTFLTQFLAREHDRDARARARQLGTAGLEASADAREAS